MSTQSNGKWIAPTFKGPVDVDLIGAGGTGSIIATRLAKLAVALPKLGHPGINVTIWDDDNVSPSNIGRQAFFAPDIGSNKAMTLVNRINLCEGLRWQAKPVRFEARNRHYGYGSTSVLIGAVDTRASRQSIHECFLIARQMIWIDCGNNAATGQVVLGAKVNQQIQLPSVADLFPEVTSAEQDATDTAPSCSLEEALERQDLMINPTIANSAVTLLWQMLRFGELSVHGVFHDLTALSSMPIPIDPAYWAAMGWNAQTGRRAPKRARKPARAASIEVQNTEPSDLALA